MNYIDADKLRAEIERRRLSNRYIDTEGYEAELFEIIDSLQQEQPEEPDKSLEEAAKEYAEGPECTWVGTTALEEAFKAGAKWQRQQMLKDAVEGEIQMRYSGCLCAKTIRAINEDKFKLGDKIRIIIVKAEEE